MKIKHTVPPARRLIGLLAALLGLAGVPFRSLALPQIVTPPQNQTNLAGSDFTYSVVATGAEPLTYQWRKHPNPSVPTFSVTNLPGATNALLILANVQPPNFLVSVVVTESGGLSVTSSTAWAFVLVPPRIVVQPTDQTRELGSGYTNRVSATGSSLSYQWYFSNDFGNAPLPNKTNSSLIITNLQTTNAGYYSVTVTNAYGATTSWPAHLSVVWFPPAIAVQPTNQALHIGSTFTCSVIVTGTPPLSRQWWFNDAPLASKTNVTLTLTNVQATNDGKYYLTVTNLWGSTTSRVARLELLLPTHGFRDIEVRSDRAPVLTFAGVPDLIFALYCDLYPLEISTNLVDWRPLALLQRTNAAPDLLQFVDTDAPNFRQRFYRTPTNVLMTPLPHPTGPYAVGTFSTALTNNRRFMITLWYPAEAQAAVLPARHVDPQLADYYDLTSYGRGDFSSQVAAFFSHSLPGAPLATNQPRYPIVLYSPGGGWHRRDNVDKAQDLASWGYVVVGMDHADTCCSVFPDGGVVSASPNFNSVQAAVNAIESRVPDAQFVLDELARWNANDPRLRGRLDLDKIGMFGSSLGGATTAQLCLRDPRLKAGAGLDGYFCETNLLTQTLSVPFLFFRSGDGPDPNGPMLGGPRLDDRLEVYNHLAADAFWVKLTSTVHGSFDDTVLVYDSASVASVFGLPTSGQFLPPGRASQIIRAYLLSFFNKFLRGADDHLLDGPSPDYPEVMQFLRK